MKEIPLTRGEVAIVSDEDFEFLSRDKWHCSVSRDGKKYAVRRGKAGEKAKAIYMHKEVLKTSKKADHINGNSLDNRRTNLREATTAQNNRNRGLSKNNTSGQTGVSYHKNDRRWQAYISVDGKRVHLGEFTSKEKAVEKRKGTEKVVYGEFAPLLQDLAIIGD